MLVARYFALTDLQGFVWVSSLIDIDMADAVSMAKDRNVAALVFDHLNQLIGSTRDHEIDVGIQLQEITHVFSCVDLLGVFQNAEKYDTINMGAHHYRFIIP